ncbi:MAG: iron ABC transporter permease [Bacteroidota bacterium]
MGNTAAYRNTFLGLALVLIVTFFLNVSLGSVAIPPIQTLKSLIGQPVDSSSWDYIIRNYRIPKALTAILVGGGLSISGLLMQTLFRNPLAGPFVLGISSGASLGAALFLMGAASVNMMAFSGFFNDISLAAAASIGSFAVLFVVVLVANRVRDTMALLIIGLMFGSITAAIVSILAYFSSAEDLQRFVFWSFGSLGDLSYTQIGLLATISVLGLLLSIAALKALNALLLGEHYARSMGISIKTARLTIICATGLFAGGITAFVGPIGFVGLAVPHLTRQVFKTMDHRILLPAVFGYGAILMLLCDILAQLPTSENVLPINAITSLVGAPVVIWLLVRKRKIVF